MSTPKYTAKSPYCEHVLDPETAVDGWVTCPCGRKSDARWVSELAWLQARGEFVEKQISDATPWYDTARGPASSEMTARPTGQGVLYVLGALSLVTAFAVFTAVAWESIGAIGQAAVLIGASLASAFIAIRTRVRLTGLANTFAFISSAVATVFFLNAPVVGLFPKAWERAQDGYPVVVLLAISLLSALLGFRLKVAGWIFVPTAAALPVWTIFNQGVVRTHLGDSHVLASSVLSGFVILVALEYLSERLLDANPNWRIGAALNSGAQALVTLVVMLTSLPTLFESVQPVIDASAYGVTGVGFLLVHRYWKRPEGLPWTLSFLRFVAIIFAGLTLGLASAWILAPGSYYSDFYPPVINNLWRQLLPAAILGALAFLASTFLKNLVASTRVFLTVYGVTVWFFGYFMLVNANGMYAPEWELFTYFGIIAITSIVCWLASSNIVQFIAGAAAGSMSVVFLIQNTLHDRINGPEPFTFAIALWLIGCLYLLKRKVAHLNSAVWFGIPYGTLLIPSAVYSVAGASGYPNDPLSWWRLWVVLLVSLVGTVVAANLRFAGVLWPSAIAYFASTFPQLFVDLQLVVPRWVFFAILGALLILTAARFERLQQLRKESGSWSEVFR